MRRSRKHMLEGQMAKDNTYSDRVTFRVPEFIYDYVDHNVQLSSLSRNRWLSDAIVAFGYRIVSPESPITLTSKQINEGVYNLIQGTKLSFTMKFEKSIPLRFTESAKCTANDIVTRFSTQLAEDETLPKNIKSKLMLIVLFDHMLRHNYSLKKANLAK